MNSKQKKFTKSAASLSDWGTFNGVVTPTVHLNHICTNHLFVQM